MSLDLALQNISKAHIPDPDHPWRKFNLNKNTTRKGDLFTLGEHSNISLASFRQAGVLLRPHKTIFTFLVIRGVEHLQAGFQEKPSPARIPGWLASTSQSCTIGGSSSSEKSTARSPSASFTATSICPVAPGATAAGSITPNSVAFFCARALRKLTRNSMT